MYIPTCLSKKTHTPGNSGKVSIVLIFLHFQTTYNCSYQAWDHSKASHYIIFNESATVVNRALLSLHILSENNSISCHISQDSVS